MAKQIIIKSKLNTAIGTLRITANLSGLNGWASSIREYIQSDSLRETLNLTRQRLRAIMIDRFRQTKGESRFTKYTQSGATEQFLKSVGTISSAPDIGFFSLSFFENDILEAYMEMQEQGWQPFTHDQTYFRSDGTSREFPVAHPVGPLQGSHSSGLGPGGRHFVQAAFEFWESSGRKQFERDRIALLQKFRKKHGI